MGNGATRGKAVAGCNIMLRRHEFYLSADHPTYLCGRELAEKAGTFHNRGRIWQRGMMACCTELHELQKFYYASFRLWSRNRADVIREIHPVSGKQMG